MSSAISQGEIGLLLLRVFLIFAASTQRHFQTAVTSQGTFNHKARYNQRSFALISWTLTAPNIARPPYFLDIVLRNVRGLMDNYEILDFKSLNETVQDLIRQATNVRKYAYCPYSNFAVGAAILTENDSKVYTGCNIESATFTPCICAERAAIPKAICDGYLKIKMVAVVAHQKSGFTAPCGVCRQTLSEFRSSDGDIEIYLSKPAMDKVLRTKLSKLLPLAFVSYITDNVIDNDKS